MREETVRQLMKFANELRGNRPIVLRSPWGRNTVEGVDAVEHINRIAQAAVTVAEQLSSETGPIESATTARRLMDLAKTADEIKTAWPESAPTTSITAAANRLRRFVITRYPDDSLT